MSSKERIPNISAANDNDLAGAPTEGEKMIARLNSDADNSKILANEPKRDHGPRATFYKAVAIEAIRRRSATHKP